jgi:hypothetical protein
MINSQRCGARTPQAKFNGSNPWVSCDRSFVARAPRAQLSDQVGETASVTWNLHERCRAARLMDQGTIESPPAWCRQDTCGITMVRKKNGVIIETPTEARQAEAGPSVLVLLTVSLIAVAIGMALVWFIFFRT